MRRGSDRCGPVADAIRGVAEPHDGVRSHACTVNGTVTGLRRASSVAAVSRLEAAVVCALHCTASGAACSACVRPGRAAPRRYGTVVSTGTRFNWYVRGGRRRAVPLCGTCAIRYAAVLDDLNRFKIALPAGGCMVRNTTTSTAREQGCAVATNAGYFQFSAKPTFCMGARPLSFPVAAAEANLTTHPTRCRRGDCDCVEHYAVGKRRRPADCRDK